MTVYADVLVITNLYVDFFLLWCVRQTLHLGVRRRRLAGGALTGALCALVCLIPGQPPWLSLLWGAVSALLTTGAAFLPLSFRLLGKSALCFWAYSLALAGLFLFFIRWLAPHNMAVVGHAVYIGLSPVLLFLFTCGAYFLFWAFRRLFPREDLTRRCCWLLLEHGGKRIKLWAKADTGCILREPFSSLPVILCQRDALKPLLPGFFPWDDNKISSQERLRLIPFDSVGGAGVLPALRLDRVVRLPEGDSLSCYVALWDQTFSTGQYQALYNPDQFPEQPSR